MNTTANDLCTLHGVSDIYGRGVRYGLYFQWMATLLASLFDPDSESNLRLANLVIQCAVFLGLCTESRVHKNPVGAMVTQFLLCGSLSSVTGDGISHLSRVSGVMRLLFYTGLSSYGCWFWFNGLNEMLRPGCQDVAFFGPTYFNGWFRTFGKACSVLGVVVCVACIGYSIYALLNRFADGVFEGLLPRPKKRPQIELTLVLASMGLLGLSIGIVEYLLRVNHVQDLDEFSSVGQLIPLIAGSTSSLLVCWKIVMDGLLWRKRCVFLFGWHL